ncbi:hypothetical protein FRB94_001912 [Tulasnella sp. JGI-2019a]|nr:hypothetical protein FRB93_004032 [Tulasnella sp. JGI-2019a]KAG9005022.1 hypothetical protein FRB94_001912 [Tulasnella sp. JGI-2019a]
MLSLLVAASFVIRPILAYTFQNVTIAATDPSILYLPACNQETLEACYGGAWWRDSTTFPNTTAMLCGDPQHQYNGNSEPYVGYSFTGSAIYVYEWLNTSTATQQFLTEDQTIYVNLTQNAPAYTSTPLSSTSQLVLAWSLTDLDPTQQHTIGIQHYATAGRNTWIALDHFVVTQAVGVVAASTTKRTGLSKGAVAGIVVGIIIFAVLSFYLLCSFLGRRNRQRSTARSHRPFAGTLSVGTQVTMQQRGTGRVPTAPQLPHLGESELERSERLAKEGMMEEDLEKPSSIV